MGGRALAADLRETGGMPLENEDRPSDSPYIHRVWRSRASGVARMTSVATSNWELVFWRYQGQVHAAARGPETTISSVDVAEGRSRGASRSRTAPRCHTCRRPASSTRRWRARTPPRPASCCAATSG
ncbi:hypothetical protein ACFQ1L_18735 [Phytohabitans flavus]|uniref:hypothetical protein n=1 Tax=Phytohabitans flavus TaxID=1076124 RepID=UPI00362DF795